MNSSADVNSSAYIRWVAPSAYTWSSIEQDPLALPFGNGPGAATALRDANTQADFPSILKVFFEEGALGTLAVIMLYFLFLRRAGIQYWLIAPLFVLQFIASNGVYNPVNVAFICLLAYRSATSRIGVDSVQSARQ